MKYWKLKLCWEPPRWLRVLALEFAEHFRQGDSLSGLAVLFRVLN
jgi:hypothetical protein